MRSLPASFLIFVCCIWLPYVPSIGPGLIILQRDSIFLRPFTEQSSPPLCVLNTLLKHYSILASCMPVLCQFHKVLVAIACYMSPNQGKQCLPRHWSCLLETVPSPLCRPSQLVCELLEKVYLSFKQSHWNYRWMLMVVSPALTWILGIQTLVVRFAQTRLLPTKSPPPTVIFKFINFSVVFFVLYFEENLMRTGK